jgi:transposase
MDDKDIIIARLTEQNALLLRQVAELTSRVRQLEDEIARLKKNSSNSSKPPSSDIVKPKPAKRTRRNVKRKRGGQHGHRKHVRPDFTPEQVDEIVAYELPETAGLQPLDDWRVIQQVALVERPFVVTEHRARRYRCRRTGRTVTAPLPPAVVRGGLLGPRLSALAAYQKGACHMSYTTIAAFLRDVLGVAVSRGHLAKVVGKVGRTLDGAYEELLERLRRQPRLGVDETGHKDNGENHWTWCFRAEGFAVFKIAPSRGSKVLREVLGETFGGVLGCDYFSAYRKYMADAGATVQFCLAHLVREVRFLAEHADKVVARWGGKLLDHLRELFGTLHRAERYTASGFARRMDAIRRAFLRQVRRPPPRSAARPLARRFKTHGASYFTFLTTPGVAPTNNLTEQAIRSVVIDRRITQGTRGQRGRRWCERIWTVLATCAAQNRSAFTFLLDSVNAAWTNHPGPSLLPQKA